MHEHTKHHGHPATELHDANGALKDPVCGMAVTSASPRRMRHSWVRGLSRFLAYGDAKMIPAKRPTL